MSGWTICGVKLMDKKGSEVLMEMLGLEESVVQMAKANAVRWYGHIIRSEDGHVLRRALDFEVKGGRKRGRPKKTWRKQVEEESSKVGLRKVDALSRARWHKGVRDIATEVNPATSADGDKPGLKLDWWWWWHPLKHVSNWCSSGIE